jgi:hypothetical protein
MTNRREFLKVGLAASALPMAAHATLAASAETLAVVPLYKVLYDTRFPASAAFARRAASHGLAVHAMGGDMTRFWYDDLYHRWQQGQAAIAGLTAHGALFCLERLAWDQRMRVIFRAEHVPAAGGCVAHLFDGPEGLVSRAAGTADNSPSWAAVMADVVAGCPAARARRLRARAHSAGAASSPLAEPLFTWVIAPAAA